MEHEGHLLLILHAVPEPDSNERVGVLFWRDPAGEWKTTARGNGLAGLQNHIQSYDGTLEALDKRLVSAAVAETYFDVLNAVVPLRRAAQNMHSVLQQTREALQDDRKIISLRDLAYNVDREADLLQAEAKNALEYLIAKDTTEQAEQAAAQAKSANRLNLLVAAFLPVTAIASVFSMNMQVGVENLGHPLFWMIIVFGMVLGFVVKTLVTPKQ